MIRALIHWIFGIPLLYKVLLANGLIVVLGATVGTLITARTVHGQDDPTEYWLIGTFAFVGIVLSLGVNYLVLRAALQPIDLLAEVAERVKEGDFSSRVGQSRFPDPQLARLGATFNETLDELEVDRDQLRQLTSQVINAQEDERKRIARELHDDTAQLLFAQLLRLIALKASEDDTVREVATSLELSTVDAIEGVRRLALELRPPALDDLGLWAALAELAQRYAERSGIEVHYDWRGSRERLPADLELVLYRIAQEALTNVEKHSGATRASITLDRKPGDVVLRVTDNGIGIAASSPESRDERGLGLGIFGMVERSSLVGGKLRVTPEEPQGVSVEAVIPLALAGRIMERAPEDGSGRRSSGVAGT